MAMLFDLDGTLLDSTADLASAANAARRAVGLEPLPESAVAAHIGWGLGHLLSHTLPPPFHDRLDHARRAFMAHYAAHVVDRSRPYPGVDAWLRARAPRSLGLVTNKPQVFVARILSELGWTDRFGAVVAGDTLAVRKPDPGPIAHALAVLGAAPDTSLFVGDSEVDMAAARAAGVPFVAVAWGRVAEKADRVIQGLAALSPQPVHSDDPRARRR